MKKIKKQFREKTVKGCRQIWLLIGLMVIGLAAEAQTINGTVISTESGETLIGATVINKRSQQGTVTDFDGGFTLSDVGSSDTLIVSYIGYLTREVPVNARKVVEVGLEISSETLDEVVVVGYGTVKKRDLTGSVASISVKDLKSTPVRSLSQVLQGRSAGVSVVQGNFSPGESSIVRIRGGNSMIGGNAPLYVVDGFPGGTVNDPDDIESIEVLKDASATSIYGSRGANGVILITTKRGGKPSINLNMFRGIQSIRSKLDLLGPEKYAELVNEKALNVGVQPYFSNLDDLPGETDWQDEVIDVAPISKINLAITGGNEETNYSIKGSVLDHQGIVGNSNYQNYHLGFNLDSDARDWLKISTSILLDHSNKEKASSQLIYNALQAPPLAPIYDENGDYFNLNDIASADPAWENPVALIDGYSDQTVQNSIQANTKLNFNIYKGLGFSSLIGFKYNNDRGDIYTKRFIRSGGNAGIAGVREANYYSLLNENLLTYNTSFNKVALNAVGGFTYQDNNSNSVSASAQDFVSDDLLTNNLASGSTILSPSSDRIRSSLLSWIGRVNTVYDDKYLVTVTVRSDGSSRLGQNHKWGVFPSAALGWRLSEENFLRDIKFLSDLKLRMSYGLTGNQDIGSYQSLSRLNSVVAIQGSTEDRVIGFVPSELENPNLKWEVTSQLDFGIDAGFFNQRVEMTLDYYKKVTDDLLARVPLSLSSGYSSILRNLGSIENQGFEIGLNSYLVDTKNFKFTLGGNISFNKNKVLKVATSDGEFLADRIATSSFGASVNIIKEGEALSSFYGYLEDGLWGEDQSEGSIQPTAKAGDIKYIDSNQDGIINDDDKVILGSPFADFVYGLTSGISYKNIHLDFLIQGQQGGMLFNVNRTVIGDAFARNANQFADVEDRWTVEQPNVDAKYPRYSNVSVLPSERYFEDASYLRLKNISISYLIPFEKLVNQEVYVYLNAENLYTITKYSGYDPEVNSTGENDLRKGIDLGAYPSAKTVTLGIKLNL